jgi:hypothetical protein
MSKIQKLSGQITKLNNKYLVIKNFVALVFFVLAALVMSPVARESDGLKVFLVIVYGLVIILSLLLITEFIVRTIRLQNETRVKRYSAIVSLNSLFGLVFPLWFANYFLMRIIELFSRMQNYNTLLCETRFAVADFYYSTDVYQFVNQLVLAVTIIAFATFFFGGVFERGYRGKK